MLYQINFSNLKKTTITLSMLLTFSLGSCVQQQIDNAANDVALDFEKQYEIAKSGGDKMDIYVHAQMVSAAYLQAKDSVNYKKWKLIEKKDGKAAGVPENNR